MEQIEIIDSDLIKIKKLSQHLIANPFEACYQIQQFFEKKGDYYSVDFDEANDEKFLAKHHSRNIDLAFRIWNGIDNYPSSKRSTKILENNLREFIGGHGYHYIPEDWEAPIFDCEEVFGFDKKIVEGVKQEIQIQKKHGRSGYIVTVIEIKKRKPVIHLFWSKTEKSGFAKANRLYKHGEVSTGKSNQTNIEQCAESACGWLQSDVERAELINFYGLDTYWSNRGNPDPLYDRMKKELKA